MSLIWSNRHGCMQWWDRWWGGVRVCMAGNACVVQLFRGRDNHCKFSVSKKWLVRETWMPIAKVKVFMSLSHTHTYIQTHTRNIHLHLVAQYKFKPFHLLIGIVQCWHLVVEAWLMAFSSYLYLSLLSMPISCPHF